MGVCEGLGDGGSADARVGVGLPPPTGMSWRAAVFAMGVAVDDKDRGDRGAGYESYPAPIVPYDAFGVWCPLTPFGLVSEGMAGKKSCSSSPPESFLRPTENDVLAKNGICSDLSMKSVSSHVINAIFFQSSSY